MKIRKQKVESRKSFLHVRYRQDFCFLPSAFCLSRKEQNP